MDALKKPLLPEGIIGNIPPYDPAIFEENGKYTIFFGAGIYHAATLGDDMISLADKPQPISVVDKYGKQKWTNDKSTVFKRGSFYYLVWGGNYAMSKNLTGPYVYKGDFLAGGHNDVFQWKGQWYAVMENKDISLFYRGVSLKPFYFNDDGTIHVPENDRDYPFDGRKWTFEYSQMGWNAVNGTEVVWEKSGKIMGELLGDTAVIESAIWLGTNIKKYNTLILKIKNKSEAKRARVSVASFIPKNKFWEYPEIDWEKEMHFEFDITSNDNEFKSYSIDLSKNPKIKEILKRIRIQPALDAKEGSWEIKYISVE